SSPTPAHPIPLNPTRGKSRSRQCDRFRVEVSFRSPCPASPSDWYGRARHEKGPPTKVEARRNESQRSDELLLSPREPTPPAVIRRAWFFGAVLFRPWPAPCRSVACCKAPRVASSSGSPASDLHSNRGLGGRYPAR